MEGKEKDWADEIAAMLFEDETDASEILLANVADELRNAERDGRLNGYDEGRVDGYVAGYDEGYDNGYDEGVDIASQANRD